MLRGKKSINQYKFTFFCVIGGVILFILAGCGPFLSPTATEPVRRSTSLPTTQTQGPSQPPSASVPPATLTPTVMPSQPRDKLVPTGPIAPPLGDFLPSPPPPPDVGSESHAPWVEDYLTQVTKMLNSGRKPAEVLGTLRDWSPVDAGNEGKMEPAAWFESSDLDGDGEEEWLFSLPVPGRGCAPVACPAYLVIFEKEDDLVHPRYVVRGNPPREIQMQHPQLVRAEDLNADGLREILITQRWCGAHTCTTGLTVGRWDGRVWRDLAEDPISQAYTELTIKDRDGDSALEFIMHGGIYGSVGAGLQRQHTLVFDWLEGAYRLVEDIPDPSSHPYYLMLDANRALAKGNWERALSLAEKALMNPNFQDTNFPVEDVDRRRIISYAAVEAMLVYAHKDDVSAMEETLNQARGYVFFEPNLYSEGAERLLDVYRDTRDVMAACAAVEEVLSGQPEKAVFFQRYGYNTERMTVDQVCPLNPAAGGESPQL